MCEPSHQRAGHVIGLVHGQRRLFVRQATPELEGCGDAQGLDHTDAAPAGELCHLQAAQGGESPDQQLLREVERILSRRARAEENGQELPVGERGRTVNQHALAGTIVDGEIGNHRNGDAHRCPSRMASTICGVAAAAVRGMANTQAELTPLACGLISIERLRWTATSPAAG